MRRPALLVSPVLAVLYLALLAPSVHVHDAGELTAAAWTLGIGHPAGAPLYMIAEKVFLTFLPFGHVAWRANIFSLAAALLCFFLAEAIAYRIVASAWLSALAALAFCLTGTFWSQAEMAEVYTLEMALLLLFLRYVTGGNPARAAFSWGLLLTCHMGLSPLTPFIVAMLAWPTPFSPGRLFRRVMAVLPCLLFPLLLYAYLPLRSLRDPALDWGNPETLQNFWWHFSNRMVRGKMLSLPAAAYFERFLQYSAIVARNALLVLPWSLAGIVIGLRKRMLPVALALLILLADACFVVLMDVAPLASEAYAIPSVLMLSLLALLPAAGGGRKRQLGYAGCLVASAILSVALFYPVNDLHRNFVTRDAAENVLSQAPRNSVVVTQEDNTTFPLAYLVAVEGARSDLVIFDRQGNLFRSPFDRRLFEVPADRLPAYRKQAEDRLVAGWLGRGVPVVYTSRFIDFVPSGWRLVPEGSVASAVWDAAAQVPPPAFAAPLPIRAPEHPDWMSRQILSYQAMAEADWLIVTGSGARARASLDRALELADMAPLALEIAQLARQSGDRQIAMESASRATTLDRWLAPAWLLHGQLLMEEGNNPAATEASLRRSLELDPRQAAAWSALGVCLARQQRREEALAAFDRSLSLSGSQADVRYNRFLVLMQSGRTDEAIPELCRFAELLPAGELQQAQLQGVLINAARLHCPQCIASWLAADAVPAHAAVIAAYSRVCSRAAVSTQAPPR